MMPARWLNQTGRTQIKICGIRDPEMALVAIDAGADAIGLVNHPPSPRHVAEDVIARIREAVPKNIPTIEVLVDPSRDKIAACRGWIQLHGEESEAIVSSASMPVIRGFSFSSSAIRRWNACDDVSILLVDGPGKGAGETFDHDQLMELKTTIRKPILLAGGLTPDNVEEIVRSVRPWGVDVSSGVESTRGVKDPGLIRAFCDAVRAADHASD